MKVIKNNAIRGVSATSENPEYPAANLLDEHPKRWWRVADASVSSVTLTVEVTGRTGGLGLVGIAAESVVVDISDPNGLTWENVIWENVEWQDVPGDLHIDQALSGDPGSAALWVSFDQFDSSVEISITLYKDALADMILGAGCLVVGEMTDLPGLQYGLGETLRDYSLARDLANGAKYYRKRDIVRVFSGSVLAARKPYFYALLLDIARVYGQRPLMWNLVDVDSWSGDAVLYGRLAAMPDGSHDYPNHSRLNFEIEEVL